MGATRPPVVLGAVVDSVQKVFDFNAKPASPVPDVGMTIDTKVIKGEAKKGEELVVILDIDLPRSAVPRLPREERWKAGTPGRWKPTETARSQKGVYRPATCRR